MSLVAVVFFVLALALPGCHEVDAQAVAIGTKPCVADVFEDLDLCCLMPKLLQYESYKTCMSEVVKKAQSAKLQQIPAAPTKTTTKKPVQKYGRRAGRAAAVGKKAQGFSLRGIIDKIGIKTKSSAAAALPSGPTCLMDCVMTQENLVGRTGELNVDAITKEFISSADATWLPIVKEAIKTCVADLKKVDPRTMPPPAEGTEQCKQNPGMFMSCVRRYLALVCPPKYKTTSPSCTAKLTSLNSCNPFLMSIESATKSG